MHAELNSGFNTKMQIHAQISQIFTAYISKNTKKNCKKKIKKIVICSLTGSGVFSICRSGISLVDVHGIEKTPTHRARKSFNENSYNLFGYY